MVYFQIWGYRAASGCVALRVRLPLERFKDDVFWRLDIFMGLHGERADKSWGKMPWGPSVGKIPSMLLGPDHGGWESLP